MCREGRKPREWRWPEKKIELLQVLAGTAGQRKRALQVSGPKYRRSSKFNPVGRLQLRLNRNDGVLMGAERVARLGGGAAGASVDAGCVYWDALKAMRRLRMGTQQKRSEREGGGQPAGRRIRPGKENGRKRKVARKGRREAGGDRRSDIRCGCGLISEEFIGLKGLAAAFCLAVTLSFSACLVVNPA